MQPALPLDPATGQIDLSSSHLARRPPGPGLRERRPVRREARRPDPGHLRDGANLRAPTSPASRHRARTSSANLTGANLQHAQLQGANLADADLTKPNLRDAKTSGATFTGATWSNTTCPGRHEQRRLRPHVPGPPRLGPTSGTDRDTDGAAPLRAARPRQVVDVGEEENERQCDEPDLRRSSCRSRRRGRRRPRRAQRASAARRSRRRAGSPARTSGRVRRRSHLRRRAGHRPRNGHRHRGLRLDRRSVGLDPEGRRAKAGNDLLRAPRPQAMSAGTVALCSTSALRNTDPRIRLAVVLPKRILDDLGDTQLGHADSSPGRLVTLPSGQAGRRRRAERGYAEGNETNAWRASGREARGHDPRVRERVEASGRSRSRARSTASRR